MLRCVKFEWLQCQFIIHSWPSWPSHKVLDFPSGVLSLRGHELCIPYEFVLLFIWSISIIAPVCMCVCHISDRAIPKTGSRHKLIRFVHHSTERKQCSDAGCCELILLIHLLQILFSFWSRRPHHPNQFSTESILAWNNLCLCIFPICMYPCWVHRPHFQSSCFPVSAYQQQWKL